MHAHRVGRVVPDENASVTDNLQAPPVHTLEVVEMTLGEHARLEMDRHLREVLGVAGEVAQVTCRAENLGRLPEEPAQIVQLVDGIEENAATQRGAYRIVVAIIPSR